MKKEDVNKMQELKQEQTKVQINSGELSTHVVS